MIRKRSQDVSVSVDTVIHPGQVSFIPPVLYNKMFTEAIQLYLIKLKVAEIQYTNEKRL